MKINLLYTRQSEFEMQSWILNWKDSIILLWHGLWWWGLEEVRNGCTNNLLRGDPAGTGMDGNQRSHQTAADSKHIWSLCQWPSCWHILGDISQLQHLFKWQRFVELSKMWCPEIILRGNIVTQKIKAFAFQPRKLMHDSSPQCSLPLLPPRLQEY